MTAMTPALRALQRRWNALAYDLVNDELASLNSRCDELLAENEELRRRLSWAEDCAESWREDALEALNAVAEATGGAPGITIDGRMVVVCAQEGAHQ